MTVVHTHSVCRGCPDADSVACDPFGCPTWARLTGPQRDLQVSGVPDPLVTGPSIRRDLWPPSRAERALGWLVATAVRDPWALVSYGLVAFTLSYVAWHVAAAVAEGRLAVPLLR